MWKYLLPLVLLFGCGGTLCETAGGAPSCDATISAIKIADDVLSANGFSKVADYVSVQWEAVDRLDDQTVDDGRILLGHSEPEINADGFYCKVTVATRLQPAISSTSFAHELIHCALVVGCFEGNVCDLLGDFQRGPYQGHTLELWDVMVVAINDALRAQSL